MQANFDMASARKTVDVSDIEPLVAPDLALSETRSNPGLTFLS